MNHLLSIFNLDRSPIDRDFYKPIEEVLPLGPYDRADTRLYSHLGITNLKLYSRKECVSSGPIFEHKPTGILVSGSFRLRNRSDLISRFNLSFVVEHEISSEELVVLCYLTCGEKCLDILKGTFQFVLYDPREDFLIAAQSPLSTSVLNVYHKDNQICITNNFACIRLLSKDELTLNLPYVLARGMRGTLAGASHAYHECQYVLPGQKLVCRNQSFTISTYWSLKQPRRRTSPLPELVEEGRSVLQDVINYHIDGALKPVGSSLSGGLDSSLLTALAAKHIKNEELVVFTTQFQSNLDSLPNMPGWTYDDSNLINDFIAQYPNIDLRTIIDDGEGEISVLHANALLSKASSSPQIVVCNNSWVIKMLRSARDSGLSDILSGQYGNSTLSWKGLKGGTLYKLTNLLGNLIGRHSFAKIDFKHGAFYQVQVPKEFGVFHKSNKSLSHLHALTKNLNNDWAFYEQLSLVALVSGVEWLTPLMDESVVEFSLAVPDQYYRSSKVNNDDVDNALHKRAFIRELGVGNLPESIRCNTTRGAQGFGSLPVIINYREQILARWKELSQSGICQQLFDLDAVRFFLGTAVFPGKGNQNNQLHSFCDALSMAEWLAAHEHQIKI